MKIAVINNGQIVIDMADISAFGFKSDNSIFLVYRSGAQSEFQYVDKESAVENFAIMNAIYFAEGVDTGDQA